MDSKSCWEIIDESTIVHKVNVSTPLSKKIHFLHKLYKGGLSPKMAHCLAQSLAHEHRRKRSCNKI